MSTRPRRIKRVLLTVLTDENLDLYVLVTVAFVFTVLGAAGIPDVKTLSSVVLGLLALLAYSQIKSRNLIREARDAQESSRLTVLSKDFPSDLITRRTQASDLLLVGLTMGRTAPGMRTDLPSILRQGSRVRIAVLDPTDDILMSLADRHRPHSPGVDQLRQRIRAVLDDLVDARERFGGSLEVRVLSTLPSSGFNCLDVMKPTGLVCIQHYEYHPDGEAAPVIALTSKDEPWYKHFAAEAERLWEDAVEWPLKDEVRLTRATRMVFSESLGEEVLVSLRLARSSLVTGVARNNLLISHFNKIEAQLRAGQRMRFLLLNPESPAVHIAAERYYAARSVEMLRERIRGSLRLLQELEHLTQGDISLRLTDHPLALGLIAVNPGEDDAAIFVEYYTYQAPGEPKFAMRPPDGFGYVTFLSEAEMLWTSGQPYSLEMGREVAN